MAGLHGGTPGDRDCGRQETLGRQRGTGEDCVRADDAFLGQTRHPFVDAAGKLTRVQVKAAFRRGKQGGYSLRTYRSSMECYTAKEIDALAGYVAPEEAWYVFPVRVVGRVRSLKLFPGSKKKRSKFERWREAWWVVTGK